jgi:serpin B
MDSLGHYRFDSVPAGTVRLIARQIGYRPLTSDSVRVRPGHTVVVDLMLMPDAFPPEPPPPTAAQLRDLADSGASGAYAGADSGRQAMYSGFSLALFRAVARRTPDSNVFLSPASAAFALAMTATGAADSTWRAMAHTLGVDPTAPDALGPANLAELTSLAAQSGVQLHIANSIWADAGRPFLPSFLAETRRWYGAEVTSMTLHGPAARARIDAWVSRATDGKIPSIVPDTMTDTTAMVLINAVYFDGHWRGVFDSTLTTPHAFVRADGEIVSRLLMSRTGSFLYLRDSGFQALRLPYRGGRLAMYVFLPDSGTSVSQFAARLDSVRWKRWMQAFHSTSVYVQLPRFHVEYSTSLTDPLQTLGMAVAFDGARADFSRMLPQSYLADTNAFLGMVLQKTYVDVDERGTRAAAVTGAFMLTTVTGMATPTDFIVDRPFCVAIRDDRTGLILFLGQITDPGPG